MVKTAEKYKWNKKQNSLPKDLLLILVAPHCLDLTLRRSQHAPIEIRTRVKWTQHRYPLLFVWRFIKNKLFFFIYIYRCLVGLFFILKIFKGSNLIQVFIYVRFKFYYYEIIIIINFLFSLIYLYILKKKMHAFYLMKENARILFNACIFILFRYLWYMYKIRKIRRPFENVHIRICILICLMI